MSKKKNFLLSTEHLEILNSLSDEDNGKLFKGIFSYVITGKSGLNGYLKTIFIPFKILIDKNEESYQKIVERNKENGAKGGRPKKQDNPVGYLETQGNPEKHDTSHIHIHNHNQEDRDKGMGKEKETFTDDVLTRIQTEFNNVGLSKVTVLSKSRKEKLKLRLKEFSEDIIIDTIKKIPNSKFLMGENKQGWKCTFDWLIENDKNLLKVYEGNYDGNEKTVEDKVNNAKEMMKYR